MQTDTKLLYQQLPQVGEILETSAMKELVRRYPRPSVLDAVRQVLESIRSEIAQGSHTGQTVSAAIDRLGERVKELLHRGSQAELQPVINATGVMLQTNLGRAPLSEEAIERIGAVARGYCNLEYDLKAGERGHRGAHAEELLLQLAGCDRHQRAPLIVNNCAAAAFLALNSLAEGGEVIVSRGELVEIGGGFRVPEILRKSGARLVEVGTTNRTCIEDYAAAITSETRVILRVHRSNFQIVGFTEQPDLRALMRLGADAGVPVVLDQGTGCVTPLEAFGLGPQSSFLAGVHSGAALVCASGDKLLGGPQCGLIIGEHNAMRRLRANPLYRALRVDKLTLAALEATLLAYLSDRPQTIPTIKMLGLSAEEIRQRCVRWADTMRCDGITAEVVPAASVVGGGTTPGATLPSFAVALQASRVSADHLAALFRSLNPPVITRIQDDLVLLDLRTVPEQMDGGTLISIRDQVHIKMASNASTDTP